MKRLFDLFLGLLLFFPCTVIILPVALCVLIDTKANPFFFQKRVGQYKNVFTLIKLRTMHPGTADGASHEIGALQITRTGKWIRRLKIDELPQILNVILGNMTFVGPRPGLPSQLELIEARDRFKLYDLKPGITGVAQLAGVDMSDPIYLAKVDATYSVSFPSDCFILLRTFFGGGSGDAANRAP